jgi:hypothetical protein
MCCAEVAGGFPRTFYDGTSGVHRGRVLWCGRVVEQLGRRPLLNIPLSLLCLSPISNLTIVLLGKKL